MCIFSVYYYRVLLALCALAMAGNVSTSAKTITDIPTHLLGDWDIVTANQWGKEERGLITPRKVPVHAWVRVTREKYDCLVASQTQKLTPSIRNIQLLFLEASHLTKSTYKTYKVIGK